MMITNTKNFLNEKMSLIFQDFQRDIYKRGYLCQLKNFNFSGTRLPNYEDEMVQKFYLLKYLPAYLTEYYCIYKQVFERNFLNENCSILSLGCGCGVDLWGLNFLKEKEKLNCSINYTGIDVVKWKYSEFSKMNGNFKNCNILDIDNLEGDYNTIIFPKSISEFNEFAFQHLKDIFAKKRFNSNKIVLIGAIRKTRIDSDLQRLEKIKDIFIRKHGYLVVDSETTISNDNAPYIYQVTNDIIFPREILNYITGLYTQCKKFKLTGKNCETACSDLLKRSPILKTSQMTFKIIYLER